jgi:hypothetical protein
MQPEFARKKKQRAENDKSSAPASTQKEARGTAPGVPHFLKSARSSASPPTVSPGTEQKESETASAKAESPGARPNLAPERYEHDADRLAEQSLNQSHSSADSKAAQTSVPSEISTAAPTSSSTINGAGEPLAEAERLHFERSMGADFSDVRVHHDAAAAREAENLNALAFTENRDIVFAAGQYQPETSGGRRVLAHELAHVTQQSSRQVAGVQRLPNPNPQPEPAQPSGPAQQVPAVAPQAGAQAPTDEFFARDAVEGIRGRSTVRYFQTSATVAAGARTIQNIKQALLRVSERYKEAYENYSQAVTAAGKEARNQQQWLDFFVGIGTGVTLGVLSEAIFVAEGATLAAEFVVEVGAEVAEGAAGAGLKATGLTQFVGQDLAPSRDLDPMVLDLEIYQLLEKLHRRVLGIAQYGDAQFLINGAAEYAIGEIRVHVAGGEQEMSEGDLLDLIFALGQADQEGRSVDRSLASFSSRLEQIESNVDSAPRQSTREIEQDIWILWMSTIKNSDSNTLDYDAIEDRLHSLGVLGSGSRLGVDFGWYTSEADELAALQAARDAAPGIRSRNRNLTSEE